MLCQCEANNNFIADLKIKIYYLRNKTKAITLNKKEKPKQRVLHQKKGGEGEERGERIMDRGGGRKSEGRVKETGHFKFFKNKI